MNSQILSRRARRNWFHFAALCLLLLIAGISTARADDTTTRTVLQATLLPFTSQHGVTGQPLVQVKINGTVDATFVLDTGTTINAISSTLAEQLNLPPKIAPGILMDGKPVYLVTPRFELGRFNFPNSPTTLLTEDQLPLEAKQKVSGIIGMNVLKLFAIIIDFQKNNILLISGGKLSADTLEAEGFGKATALPLSQNKDAIPVVQALFASETKQALETLIVDTGSDNTEVSNSLARILNLPMLRETDSWGLITGDYKKSWSQATLTLGDITLPNQEVSFAGSDKAKAFPVLGVDVLSRYRVLIDFPASKMYLAPSVPAVVQVKQVGPAVPPFGPKP